MECVLWQKVDRNQLVIKNIMVGLAYINIFQVHQYFNSNLKFIRNI